MSRKSRAKLKTQAKPPDYIQEKMDRLERSRGSRCTILRLDCTNDLDARRVEELAQIETKQKDFFQEYLTLASNGCPKNSIYVYYVAFDPQTSDLCGVCQTQVNPEKNMIEINYLASRASLDPSFRGVGTRLLDQIIIDAYYNPKIHFVYLLSDSNATGFYDHYGLIPIHSDWYNYVYSVKGRTFWMKSFVDSIINNDLASFQEGLKFFLKGGICNKITLLLLYLAANNQSFEVYKEMLVRTKLPFERYARRIFQDKTLPLSYLLFWLDHSPIQKQSKGLIQHINSYLAIFYNNPSLIQQARENRSLYSIDWFATALEADRKTLVHEIYSELREKDKKKVGKNSSLLEPLIQYKYNVILQDLYSKGYLKHTIDEILFNAFDNNNTGIIDMLRSYLDGFIEKFANSPGLLSIALKSDFSRVINIALQHSDQWWRSRNSDYIRYIITLDLARGSEQILMKVIDLDIPWVHRRILNTAIFYGYDKLAEYILRQGVQFDGLSLDAAIQSRNMDWIKRILSSGVRGTKDTLSLAIELNDPELLELLQQSKVMITMDHLALAFKWQKFKIVRWLLKNGLLKEIQKLAN